ncbi:acid phosphatase [Devosia pacifica]|uniref:acid phosphatase n=1 Tax=Devosia pacifica TaxID=1335967 RepID=A0A918S5Q4_9HYPH|nr:tartrate-resistant acid phosphatase type 5 family protein [Devosia pacifica]GHA21651.1 acid phosphatase [Devosia pacifica]
MLQTNVLDPRRQWRQNRRQVLFFGGALGLSVMARGSHAAEASEESLGILVVGDWGKPENLSDLQRVAQAMGSVYRQSGADCVFSTGDNFYENGVVSTSDPLWLNVFEDVFTEMLLPLPWYVVLGNHDHRGSTAAELSYHEHDERWNLPASYYTRSWPLPGGGDADVLFIDTQPLVEMSWWRDALGQERDARKQLDWIEAELAASTAEWKIVVGHHPVFSGGAHGDSPALIASLKPLFERYGVQLYLNGHDHNLEHAIVDGIHYLTSGAGAETRGATAGANTQFIAGQTGFLRLQFTDAALMIEFFDNAGERIHQHQLGRPVRNQLFG